MKTFEVFLDFDGTVCEGCSYNHWFLQNVLNFRNVDDFWYKIVRPYVLHNRMSIEDRCSYLQVFKYFKNVNEGTLYEGGRNVEPRVGFSNFMQLMQEKKATYIHFISSCLTPLIQGFVDKYCKQYNIPIKIHACDMDYKKGKIIKTINSEEKLSYVKRIVEANTKPSKYLCIGDELGDCGYIRYINKIPDSKALFFAFGKYKDYQKSILYNMESSGVGIYWNKNPFFELVVDEQVYNLIKI